MMSIQLKIWKRLIANEVPLSCNHPSIAMSLLPSLAFYAKTHIKFANFCNQMTTSSTTPPGRGAATEFLISKCGLTDKDITKAKSLRNWNHLLRSKWSQNMEDVLELLNGCGVTTPIQLRRVVLCNPMFLHLRAGRNLKSKLSFLRTFMKKDDISKLVMNNARIFNSAEDKLKSAISLLQRLGVERKELSHLVANQPLLLTSTEEKVIESFKQAENLGFKKGSKLFAAAMRAFALSGKDKLEQKLYYLSSLGFSKEQVSRLCGREPFILALSEEKLKRNADFLVNSMALPLADVAKYPNLFSNSLEKRIIPRYRVIEALKPMQVQEFKRRICLGDIAFLTEKTFLEKYVNKNAESSYLLDIYNGGKARKLIIDKETGSECLSIKGIQEISESLSGPST